MFWKNYIMRMWHISYFYHISFTVSLNVSSKRRKFSSSHENKNKVESTCNEQLWYDVLLCHFLVFLMSTLEGSYYAKEGHNKTWNFKKWRFPAVLSMHSNKQIFKPSSVKIWKDSGLRVVKQTKKNFISHKFLSTARWIMCIAWHAPWILRLWIVQ